MFSATLLWPPILNLPYSSNLKDYLKKKQLHFVVHFYIWKPIFIRKKKKRALVNHHFEIKSHMT